MKIEITDLEDLLNDFEKELKKINKFTRVWWRIQSIPGRLLEVIKDIRHISRNFWILKHFFTFRGWDACYSYRLMGDMFEAMEKDFVRGSKVLDTNEDVKSLMICKNCCKYLAEDYFTSPVKGLIRREVLASEIKRHGFWSW
jgi:hypothetical protein